MRRLPAHYAVAQAVHRRYGTTYYLATQVLPRERRRHVYALYAFCRLADEIVDGDGGTSAHDRASALIGLERQFWRAWEGDTSDPVLSALVETMRQTGLSPASIERFLRSMAMDLTVTSYETWEDLCGYMDGSAAVIGEMVLPVLCPLPVPGTLGPARQLGIAFQMTNFLRDVGEDLGRGRVYLPAEDLRRFGADPWARAVTPGWVNLMQYEMARTRRIYIEAERGIALLPAGSAQCVRAATLLYRRILRKIEANGYDVFTRRARVGVALKASVAVGEALSYAAARICRPLRPIAVASSEAGPRWRQLRHEP
jgi:15-cis-phytoene synthase